STLALAISSSRIQADDREMRCIETIATVHLQTLLQKPDSRAWRLARGSPLQTTMGTGFLTYTSLPMDGTRFTTTMVMGPSLMSPRKLDLKTPIGPHRQSGLTTTMTASSTSLFVV